MLYDLTQSKKSGILRMVSLPQCHLHPRNRSKDMLPLDFCRVKSRIIEVYCVIQQFLCSSFEVELLIYNKGEEVVIEGDCFLHYALFSDQYHPHIFPKFLVTSLSFNEIWETAMDCGSHLIFYLHFCHFVQYKMYYSRDIW